MRMQVVNSKHMCRLTSAQLRHVRSLCVSVCQVGVSTQPVRTLAPVCAFACTSVTFGRRAVEKGSALLLQPCNLVLCFTAAGVVLVLNTSGVIRWAPLRARD